LDRVELQEIVPNSTPLVRLQAGIGEVGNSRLICPLPDEGALKISSHELEFIIAVKMLAHFFLLMFKKQGKESRRKFTMADSVSHKRRKLDHTQDDNNDAIFAGGLYKSSVFKLKVDEMLAEVQPNYEKRASVIDDALHRLKGLIEGIEDREALPVSLEL
jgi:hypothetical protein